jgi:hypothetical protein
MPRVCTICASKACQEIDMALVSKNSSIRDIARQYRVGRSALTRHVNAGHMSPKIKEAKRAFDAVAGENLLNKIERIYKRFDELAEKQKRIGDDKTELNVYHELRGYMEMEGKATGAFREKIEHSGDMNITNKLSDEEVEERALAILAKKRK